MDTNLGTDALMAIFRLARTDPNLALIQADEICDPRQKLVENLDIKTTIYSWSGDFGNAEECILRAISIEPNNVHLIYQAGMLYFKFYKFSLSSEFFEKCIEVFDEHAKNIYQEAIFAHLGYCLAKLGRLDRARYLLEACDADRQIWLHGLTTPRQLLQSII